ncbi:hypothetical protein DENSPDRAFT_854036 [Dentipellis sp. KUC8613]|nr:hypothetical protein DENSPDRAFT_854036 [Dentipellis sp. KUC8613]
MANNEPFSSKSKPLEVCVARLEDALRDAVYQKDAAEKQLTREKEDFERQISRLKEDMAVEAKRTEQDLKEARRMCDELRAVMTKREKEAERDRAEWKERALRTELELSRGRTGKTEKSPMLVRSSTAASLPTPTSVTQPISEVKVKIESSEPSLKRPRSSHGQSPSEQNEADPKHRRLTKDEEPQGGIIGLHNPEVKVKEGQSSALAKDAMTLHTTSEPHAWTPEIPFFIKNCNSCLYHRIANIPFFSVQMPNDFSPASIPRPFIMDKYGVNGDVFVRVHSQLNVPPGSTRYMLLPPYNCSPCLPYRPGAPGVMLTNDADILGRGPVSLWIKQSAGKNSWRYFGNYELSRSKTPLTAAEARGLDEIHALIFQISPLRRPGRGQECYQPSNGTATQNFDQKSPVNLKPDDILEALQSWEETLNVVTMRCVGYDYDFLKDIEARWGAWKVEEARHKLMV